MYGITAARCASVSIDPDYAEDRFVSMTSDNNTLTIMTNSSDERRMKLVNCSLLVLALQIYTIPTP
jgi:non-ribosomal peptide synthetase component F